MKIIGLIEENKKIERKPVKVEEPKKEEKNKKEK